MAVALVAPASLVATATLILLIAARANAQTWGYITGNSDSSLTCPDDYPLTYAGIGSNFPGCCNDFSCQSPPYRGCSRYGDPPCGEICSTVFTTWLDCSQALPSCVTYFLLFGSDESVAATSFSCAATAATFSVVTTPTNGAAATSTLTAASAGPTASSAAPTATSGTSAQSGNSASPGTLDESDKIDLGVGIGVGAPGAIVACAIIYRFIIKRCLSQHTATGP